jgi:hypothetical protein
MTDITNILQKLSQVTGVENLEDFYKKARSTEKDSEIDRVREALPNRQARSRYDKERKKQHKDHSPRKVKRSNLRIIARLKDKLLKGGVENPCPALIPAHLWLDCQAMIADQTGKVIREYANMLDNKIALTRIHRAALGMLSTKNIDARDFLVDSVQDLPVSNKGEDLTRTVDDRAKCPLIRAYSYAGSDVGALRARRVFALGWLLVKLSKVTARKGKYNRLVSGIPQAALIGALRDPYTGKHVHRTTISGRHRYVGQPGEIGYLDALKAADVLYTRQAIWTGDKPQTKGWEDIKAEEMAGETPDGLKFSLDRYWIISSQHTSPKDAAEKAILWCDWLAGCQPWEMWLSPEPALSDVHGKTSGLLTEKPPD